MSPSQVHGRPSRPRRTVRIVKPRWISRTTTVSLLIVSAAALSLFVMWRFSRAEETVEPVIRTLRDVGFDWKCEAGHSFYESGQAGARACIKCGRPAYPVDEYKCSIHGRYPVSVRFVIDSDGKPRVSELRQCKGVDASRWGQWVFATDGVLCPRCGRKLVRPRRDPLARSVGRSGKPK